MKKFVIVQTWIDGIASDGQTISTSCPIAVADTVESANKFIMDFEPDDKAIKDTCDRRENGTLFRSVTTDMWDFNLIVEEVMAI